MRLFVAVNLPPDVRERLWGAAAPLRARDLPVRWVPADDLHLTVKFLGDVDAETAELIPVALETAVAGLKPFVLPLAGFGAFPALGRPNTLWVGCEPVPPLELLYHGVERELGALGFAPEGRPFRPHLTLGRVKRHADRRAFAELAEEQAPIDEAFDALVTSLDLMESRLGPHGAQYALNHAVSLGPV